MRIRTTKEKRREKDFSRNPFASGERGEGCVRRPSVLTSAVLWDITSWTSEISIRCCKAVTRFDQERKREKGKQKDSHLDSPRLAWRKEEQRTKGKKERRRRGGRTQCG